MKRSILVTAVMLMLLAAAGAFGGVVFYGQIKALRSELASAKRELAGTRDRLSRLERRIETTAPQPASPHGRIMSPTESGAAVASDAPLELSREETRLVRDYIKLPPAPPGVAPTMAVGVAVPDTLLMPLPPQITDKFPRLLGARFATDRNGTIVIVRRGSRVADAMITP